jgi:acetoin utilization protein AcuB
MTNKEWMSRPVHVAAPSNTLAHARQLLARYRINQLPVVADDRLVGIVTDRDMRSTWVAVADKGESTPEVKRKETPVSDAMTADVLTLGPTDTVDQTARLMREHRISSVPIVEEGKLLGIITRSDILDAYVGLYERWKQASASGEPKP